jgi:hypothetical protein
MPTPLTYTKKMDNRAKEQTEDIKTQLSSLTRALERLYGESFAEKLSTVASAKKIGLMVYENSGRITRLSRPSPNELVMECSTSSGSVAYRISEDGTVAIEPLEPL